MDRNLYDVLGVDKDATPDQIRRAYKEKALQTHPDKVPPGASAAEKAASEDQFRRVNHAYEILYDPQNRREYDTHGTWGENRTAFTNPFFSSGPFGNPFPAPFTFTDPFILFDSIFGEGQQHRLRNHLSDLRYHQHHGSSMYPSDTFFGMNHSIGNGVYDPRHRFPFDRNPPRPIGPHQSGTTSLFGASDMLESQETFTINGVTQSVRKRTDPDGNIHVTHTYPDGRETYTINGIEQNSTSRRLTSGPQTEIQDSHRHHSTRTPSVSSGGSRNGTVPGGAPDEPKSNPKWWRGGW